MINKMHHYFHDLVQMAESGLKYIILSTLLAGASVPIIFQKKGPARKEAFAYFISSFIFSISAGLVADQTPILEDFSWVIASCAYIFGATTYSLVMTKSIFEVLSMYVNAHEGREISAPTERMEKVDEAHQEVKKDN